jgi:DNA-binding IclR family transcriptional regulator
MLSHELNRDDLTDTHSAGLRSIGLLEYIARARGPVSLVEATEASGLPKPTVYRLLKTLHGHGLLQREPATKRYSIGPRLSALGRDILQNSTVRAERHGILKRLVEEIGETCNFTMLDGNDVLYVDRVETSASVRPHLEAGTRAPLHCTASGKLFLSQMKPEQVLKILGPGPLQRYTDKTISDPKKLLRELKRIREEGVSADRGEWDTDSVCLAVPVRDSAGRVCAAIAVHGPTSRLSIETAHRHLPALRRAAAQIGSGEPT